MSSELFQKGALHHHLGVPEGEKIPQEKLRGALHSGNATIFAKRLNWPLPLRA